MMRVEENTVLERLTRAEKSVIAFILNNNNKSTVYVTDNTLTCSVSGVVFCSGRENNVPVVYELLWVHELVLKIMMIH